MKRTKLAFKILKKMNVDKIVVSFISLMILCSFLLTLVEPEINDIFTGLWYSFVAFTTIGFGDIVAITLIGRIITVILSLYGIILVAIMTGVLVSYYQELNNLRLKISTEELLDKIDRLPELSKEELTEISKKIKKKLENIWGVYNENINNM